MEINVLNNLGEVSKFNSRLITDSIIKETNLSREEAARIKNSIVKTIKANYREEISTSEIRSLINAQLIKRGYLDDVSNSLKLGMSVNDFTELLSNGCSDNANINYTPEMIAKYAYDAVAKEYALLTMPKECSEAHKEGYIHIHDLEYYNTRANCMNYDLRFFARNGLKIDGVGDTGAVASPAKSLEVILNHMLQAWMAGAVVFSGGQGYVNFNTLLSPYAKDRTYEDIKQAIQGFIFNCNMSLVCRGGQILFTSIALDLSCPGVLKDEPAIGPEGIPLGVYGDYQAEADLIFRAVCEVLDEKDAEGAYFRFPNTLFNIRPGDLDEYTGNCKLLHELSSKNPTIYYNNCILCERSTMGALSSDTPVMTDKGFRYPYELNIGDTVMTYSDDGSKEWNKIYNVIEKPAPDKLFEIICDNGYSFKVTSNHKLPTNKGIIKSEDLRVGMELYNYVDEPFVPVDDLEAEFIGIFLADGFIRHKPRHQKNSLKIEFHMRKEWKAKELVRIIEALDYDYTYQEQKDGSISINVDELDLRNKLVKLYDDNLNVKRFPQEYWHDKNKLANIIKGLMFDGRKQSNTSYVWSSSDKELVYDVCYALSYIGLYSSIYIDNRKGKTGNWRTNYRITFGANNKPKHTTGRKPTTIKAIVSVDNTDCVYDLSIENNPNYVCGLGGIHSENCRTSLPMNYRENYREDCMNTGNFAYNSINLPLIAEECESIDDYFSRLDEICETCYTSLTHRRATVYDVIHNKRMSTFLLWRDKDTDEPLYDLDRTTITLGFVGLNETLNILRRKFGTLDKNLGEDIIGYLNIKKEEFHDRDGLRWSVIGSPAESTAGRFARINLSKYPETMVQGTKNAPYLSNSSHLPVNSGELITAHIRNSNTYHEYTLGGNILHLWLGEAYPDPESLWKFNQKISRTNTIFWAYSSVFTFCRECSFTINDDITECPVCRSRDLRSYDRITGYYLPRPTWNKSKLAESKDRFRHQAEAFDK